MGRPLAVGAACLAAWAALLPMLTRRAIWAVHRAPKNQQLHVAKYPPDMFDNDVRGVPMNSVMTDERIGPEWSPSCSRFEGVSSGQSFGRIEGGSSTPRLRPWMVRGAPRTIRAAASGGGAILTSLLT